MKAFLNEEISVGEYISEYNNWCRSIECDTLPDKLSDKVSVYGEFYIDRYYGEELPKWGWWERLMRKMDGLPDVDLATLKRMTLDLLNDLQSMEGR